MNYYEILGVSLTTNPEEIKKAYRQKARELHPDTLPTDVSETERNMATEKFQELNHAYEILSDEAKRKEYDETFKHSQKEELIARISEFYEKEQYHQALECAKQLYELLPEDAQSCDTYAEILRLIAGEEAETEKNYEKAKEYLTIALKVVKSEEIKKQIEADLELIRSDTKSSTGGSEAMFEEDDPCKVTTEKAIMMLKAGSAGKKAWNQFRQCETYLPNLEEVDLSGIELREINLSGVNLKKSKFVGTKLYYVNFSNSNLSEVDFSQSEIIGVNFAGAILERAVFGNSLIRKKDFGNTNFCKTNLTNADLSGLDLTEIDFQNAIFCNTKCLGTNFFNANLKGCSLYGCILDKQTNLSNANY
jgi:uncharacterized protein YjbI with pentapeptide repeats